MDGRLKTAIELQRGKSARGKLVEKASAKGNSGRQYMATDTIQYNERSGDNLARASSIDVERDMRRPTRKLSKYRLQHVN